MSTRLRGLIPSCCAIVVAFGLAVGTASAYYDSGDTRFPSPNYVNTNTVVYNTPGGPIQVDSFFDIFTDLDRVPPPPPGPPTIHSFFDVFTEIDLTTPLGPITGTADSSGDILMQTQPGLPPGEPVIDTEMLQLDLTGPGLPPGFRIRESPTLPSLGQTSIQDLGGGVYRIDSFFDVFTELSLDGGATWTPSNGPIHLTGTPEPGSLTLLGIAGLTALCRRRR